MVESSLVLTERDVQDGRLRIVRQEATIERLRSRVRRAPLHEAREMLELFYRVQERFEIYLERARAEASCPQGGRAGSYLGRGENPR